MLAASCNSEQIKNREICVWSAEDQRLGCDDPRLDEEERQYTRAMSPGDFVTNREDFFDGEEEVLDVLEENAELRGDLRQCQARR